MIECEVKRIALDQFIRLPDQIMSLRIDKKIQPELTLFCEVILLVLYAGNDKD